MAPRTAQGSIHLVLDIVDEYHGFEKQVYARKQHLPAKASVIGVSLFVDQGRSSCSNVIGDSTER